MPKRTPDILNSLPGLRLLLPVFDLLPEVNFFLKDRRRRFVALNRTGCDLCGIHHDGEAIGLTDRDFFPAEQASYYMADDEAILKSGQPVLNRVEPAPARDGVSGMVVTSKLPLRDAKGQVIGLVGISRRLEHLRYTPEALKGIASAIRLLHENLEQPLTTTELARNAGISERKLERSFQKALGTSPRKYLQRVRLDEARRLLAETEEPLSQVALRCGFYDHAHFTRAFKEGVGQTPSQYRKSRSATA